MAANPPPQTFNHVAMSVPAALLDAKGRASLLDFFGEVFEFVRLESFEQRNAREALGFFTEVGHVCGHVLILFH